MYACMYVCMYEQIQPITMQHRPLVSRHQGRDLCPLQTNHLTQYTHTHTHTHIHTHPYAHTHTHTYMYTYICIYMCKDHHY